MRTRSRGMHLLDEAVLPRRPPDQLQHPAERTLPAPSLTLAHTPLSALLRRSTVRAARLATRALRPRSRPLRWPTSWGTCAARASRRRPGAPSDLAARARPDHLPAIWPRDLALRSLASDCTPPRQRQAAAQSVSGAVWSRFKNATLPLPFARIGPRLVDANPCSFFTVITPETPA